MNDSGLTIEQSGRLLRAREVTARELTETCLQNIDRHNSTLNAFITVTAGMAREQADMADRELAAGHDRGPLHGVPVSVKDVLDMQGTPTTAASRVREGHVARRDSAVVTALRRAGAVIVGKTNLHEFAFGTTSEDSAYGPVRNPHDPTRSPGGSSGGSAVSIVTGMSLASIGTDTGGSIRIPAAACGVVGLKPTYGEVSTDAVVPLSRALDHVGPLAKTVRDIWLVYRALTDPEGPKTIGAAPPTSFRLGVPRRYFCELLDDGVRTAFERSLDAVRRAGIRLIDVEIPHAEVAPAIYLAQVFGDAAAFHATTLESVPEKYTTPVRLRFEMARYVLAEDYVRAIEGRTVLRREVDVALSSCDALVLPSLPIEAPPIGAATVRVAGRDEPVRAIMLRLTQVFNLTGHPAISIPCGASAAGLPYGLQLVGPRMQTDALCSIAAAVEPLLP
jgi:aspartyl-tRNA(Asn)/glutamyl-tRNA(Gln) amidotransferase subunit A